MSDSWWTSWTSAHQALLFFTTSRSLLKSHPLSQWCYLTTSSSAAAFSFCLQSFPASRSFPVSRFSCKATQTQDSVSQVPGHRWRKLSGKGHQLMLVEASHAWSLPRAAGSLVAPPRISGGPTCKASRHLLSQHLPLSSWKRYKPHWISQGRNWVLITESQSPLDVSCVNEWKCITIQQN